MGVLARALCNRNYGNIKDLVASINNRGGLLTNTIYRRVAESLVVADLSDSVVLLRDLLDKNLAIPDDTFRGDMYRRLWASLTHSPEKCTSHALSMFLAVAEQEKVPGNVEQLVEPILDLPFRYVSVPSDQISRAAALYRKAGRAPSTQLELALS